MRLYAICIRTAASITRPSRRRTHTVAMNLGTVKSQPRIWLRRGRLDRMIAEGVGSAESPELARRATEIRTTHALIENLATHLDDEGPVTPRGVAVVERLLTWGGSPLYAPHPDGALDADLRHARAALLLAE